MFYYLPAKACIAENEIKQEKEHLIIIKETGSSHEILERETISG